MAPTLPKELWTLNRFGQAKNCARPALADPAKTTMTNLDSEVQVCPGGSCHGLVSISPVARTGLCACGRCLWNGWRLLQELLHGAYALLNNHYPQTDIIAMLEGGPEPGPGAGLFSPTKFAKQGDLGSAVLPKQPAGAVWAAGSVAEVWRVETVNTKHHCVTITTFKLHDQYHSYTSDKMTLAT